MFSNRVDIFNVFTSKTKTNNDMLLNTVTLYPAGTTFEERITSLVDVDNGKSRRQVDFGPDGLVRLQIGHASSKENPTVQTTRHLVRLDAVKPDPTTPLKNITASVQLVIVDPKGDAGVTVPELVYMLVNFLIVGDGTSNPNTTTGLTLAPMYGDIQTTVSRLQSGEV